MSKKQNPADKVEQWPIEKLVPYAKNSRTHSEEQVALFEYQMLNNTKGGDLVLDSFGGSGTTLIAAEKNGRVARLMELDPKYCDVIVKRWMDFTGKIATHADTGKPFAEVTHGNEAKETAAA